MSAAKRPRTDSRGGEEGNPSSNQLNTIIPDRGSLQCPICLELPKAEVYLCSNGHSVCSECIQKLPNCPDCRVPYPTGSGRIRSHFAEKILDSVQFRCMWREQGCDRKKLKRQELTEHEEQCHFNPISIHLCRILFRGRCTHKVSPEFLRNPRVGLPARFLAHLQARHAAGSNFSKTVVSGRPTHLLLTEPIVKSMFGTILFHFGICNLLSTSPPRHPLGLYMLFCYQDVTDPASIFKLSWFFVRLTDPPKQFGAVSVRFTLRSCIVDANGYPKVETSWTGQILSLEEFEEFNKKLIPEKDKFEFSLPRRHVREHYLDEDGDVFLKFVFNVGTDDDSSETEDAEH